MVPLKVNILHLAIVMMMILFCLVPRSALAFSPTASKHHLRLHHQLGKITSVCSSQRTTRIFSSSQHGLSARRSHYSVATLERIEGLDSQEELSALALRLKTAEEKVRLLLQKQLSELATRREQTPKAVEKREYLDWLLAGSASRSDAGSSASFKPEQSSFNLHSPHNGKIRTNHGDQQQTFSTGVKFAERPDLHPNSKRAIDAMGLETLTEIQDKTFAAAATGSDVLGRARTGTGKTVAFLLPAIERILQLGVDQEEKIGIVVVSPTRELATQIGDQAEKLCSFHRDMSVQVMFGGTNMKRDITRLSQRLPTILVATPGRLLDHLQNTRVGNQLFGKDIMSQTPIVVLDETDRLLDMGFRREITKILGYMPSPEKRQTLLFSATIPPELKAIMAQNMNKDYIEVDCINDGDAATHTNSMVQQSHCIIPANSDQMVSSVVDIVRLAVEEDDTSDIPPKIVVFFPTARLVNFFAEIFNQGKFVSLPVLELHSKKSQAYRNRVSEDFRKMKTGVLFTSDVSARGVDYPNVSHVLQFGMPESREQYIHRLGRTGRGGTAGKGWLILSEWESIFLQELKGVDIPVDEQLRDIMSHARHNKDSQDKSLEQIRQRVRRGDKVLSKSAEGAYQAFLGYYLGQMKRMKMKQKEDLVQIANDFALMSGLSEPPKIAKQLVAKMGLKGVQGVNIGHATPGRDRHSGHHRSSHSDGRRPPKNKAGGSGRRRG